MTATVTSGATGKVTFYDGVTILGIGMLSGGQASISTVMLPSGSRKLRAYYQGDGTYAASSSARLPETVVALPELGFDPALTAPTAVAAWAEAVGDFNADGKQDLAILTQSGSVAICLGNGDGTFRPAVNYAAGGARAFAEGDIAVVDINGDGHMDIVTDAGNSPSISILLGNGDGTFKIPGYATVSGDPTSVTVADFNGDGIPDLLVTSTYASSFYLSVLLGNGDGTFQTEQIVESTSAFVLGNLGSKAEAADLAAYARTDIIMNWAGAPGVFLGNGDGTFGRPLVSGSGNNWGVPVIADFNGDGKLGAAFIDGTAVDLLPGNGDGTFGAAVQYAVPIGMTFGAAGDFNRDGRADLVLASAGNTGYAVLLGDAVTPVSIQTVPAGLQFTIDSAATQIAPQTVNLSPGTHTIAVASLQTAPGTQYLFTNWSVSGAASLNITVTAPATYTATFQTQYLLTTAAYPQPGGSVTPTSGTYYTPALQSRSPRPPTRP